MLAIVEWSRYQSVGFASKDVFVNQTGNKIIWCNVYNQVQKLMDKQQNLRETSIS